MPTNVEVMLEGLRNASEGLKQFGQNRERSREAEAKAEAERLKRERLGAIGVEIKDIADEVGANPDYSREDFTARTGPLIQQIVESGDMSSLQALNDARSQIDAREKAKREAEKAKADAATEGKKDQKAAGDLDIKKKQIAQDIGAKHRGASKTALDMQTSYNTILGAAEGEPSGAKDLQLVTAFMKSVDPGSTVRETEFKNAAEARSFWSENTKTDANGNLTTKNGIPLPGFVQQAIQKYEFGSKGGFLLPEQRAEFLNSAEDSYDRQLAVQEGNDTQYERQLKDIDQGLDRDTYLTFNAKKEREKITARRAKVKADKEARDKEESLKIKTDGSGKKRKVVGKAFVEATIKKNSAAWAKIQAEEEAKLGRPFTAEEKNDFIAQKFEKDGFIIDKNAP